MARHLDLDTLDDRFDAFCVAIFIAYVVFLTASLWSDYRDATDGSVDRREDVLDRLESGETVRVERWHGHTLELEGELIVDADRLDHEEETDD